MQLNGLQRLLLELGLKMKGALPKHIAAVNLQCAKCIHFRDNDPDLFYCNLDRPEAV